MKRRWINYEGEDPPAPAPAPPPAEPAGIPCLLKEGDIPSLEFHQDKKQRLEGLPFQMGMRPPNFPGMNFPGTGSMNFPGGSANARPALPGGGGMKLPGGAPMNLPGGTPVKLPGGAPGNLPGGAAVNLPGGGVKLPGGGGGPASGPVRPNQPPPFLPGGNPQVCLISSLEYVTWGKNYAAYCDWFAA